MKTYKLWRAALALGVFVLGLAACERKSAQTAAPADLTVHYYRYDGDFEGWNLWLWPSGKDGQSFAFGESPGEDGFVTASIDWPDAAAKDGEFGIIVRRSEPGNDWAEKDTSADRYTTEKEIWIVQGDEKLYTQKPEISGPPVVDAAANEPGVVTVQLMTAVEDFGDFSVWKNGEKVPGVSKKGKTAKQVVITLEEPITDPSLDYTVRDGAGLFGVKRVRMGTILDNFAYTGSDLGAVWAAEKTTWALWAPTAQTVELALYDGPGTYDERGQVTDNENCRLVPMTREAKTGVWRASVSGDQDGVFYLYRVRFAGDEAAHFAADPYAKAAGANGQRMAVVNPASTDPSGWASDASPAFSGRQQDAVLYELHVRDFSVDPDSGMTNKGKFLAFTETGTKNREGAATGVDHIKALGVTHVHLLPSFDFASVNEAAPAGSSAPKFNWGYDPQNYNIPEGSYSSDPFDPKARIREFKQMVQALHRAGIRVVMDVVYNHTYSTGAGPFDSVVPMYYYRINAQGGYSNGSGCGNEVASENAMVRRYIVDSVKYWQREYHIDGFRFDLMALIDTVTMDEITAALRQHDSTAIIYGEPWQAGGSTLPSTLQTTVGKQKGKGYAIFNDRIREAVKGGNDDASKGFATGAAGKEEAIVKGVMGSVNDITSRASESINYASAHDNLCLWDKLSTSYGAADLAASPYGLIDPGKPLFGNDAVKSDLLANGIILTSQGIPFFQAGDEFLRSKLGDHNSYASGDEVNRLRWENAAKYSEAVSYYAGLIALRKAHPAFRLDSKAEIEAALAIVTARDGVVAYTLNGGKSGDSWPEIFVVYNGGASPATLDLPAGGAWKQVVDANSAGTETLREVNASITVDALTMAVLRR